MTAASAARIGAEAGGITGFAKDLGKAALETAFPGLSGLNELITKNFMSSVDREQKSDFDAASAKASGGSVNISTQVMEDKLDLIHIELKEMRLQHEKTNNLLENLVSRGEGGGSSSGGSLGDAAVGAAEGAVAGSLLSNGGALLRGFMSNPVVAGAIAVGVLGSLAYMNKDKIREFFLPTPEERQKGRDTYNRVMGNPIGTEPDHPGTRGALGPTVEKLRDLYRSQNHMSRWGEYDVGGGLNKSISLPPEFVPFSGKSFKYYGPVNDFAIPHPPHNKNIVTPYHPLGAEDERTMKKYNSIHHGYYKDNWRGPYDIGGSYLPSAGPHEHEGPMWKRFSTVPHNKNIVSSDVVNNDYMTRAPNVKLDPSKLNSTIKEEAEVDRQISASKMNLKNPMFSGPQKNHIEEEIKSLEKRKLELQEQKDKIQHDINESINKELQERNLKLIGKTSYNKNDDGEVHNNLIPAGKFSVPNLEYYNKKSLFQNASYSGENGNDPQYIDLLKKIDKTNTELMAIKDEIRRLVEVSSTVGNMGGIGYSLQNLKNQEANLQATHNHLQSLLPSSSTLSSGINAMSRVGGPGIIPNTSTATTSSASNPLTDTNNPIYKIMHGQISGGRRQGAIGSHGSTGSKGTLNQGSSDDDYTLSPEDQTAWNNLQNGGSITSDSSTAKKLDKLSPDQLSSMGIKKGNDGNYSAAGGDDSSTTTRTYNPPNFDASLVNNQNTMGVLTGGSAATEMEKAGVTNQDALKHMRETGAITQSDMNNIVTDMAKKGGISDPGILKSLSEGKQLTQEQMKSIPKETLEKFNTQVTAARMKPLYTDTKSKGQGGNAQGYKQFSKDLGSRPNQVKSNVAATKGTLSQSSTETANKLTEHLMSTYKLSREQAVGAVGVMGYESGNFKTLQEQAPTIPGTSGGYGYAQWTGHRRVEFEKFAANTGLNPASYEANEGFMDYELTHKYKGTIPALKTESDVQGSARSWEENYEGMREGGPGIPAFEKHMARAQQYYDKGIGLPTSQNSSKGNVISGGGSKVTNSKDSISSSSSSWMDTVKKAAAGTSDILGKVNKTMDSNQKKLQSNVISSGGSSGIKSAATGPFSTEKDAVDFGKTMQDVDVKTPEGHAKMVNYMKSAGVDTNNVDNLTWCGNFVSASLRHAGKEAPNQGDSNERAWSTWSKAGTPVEAGKEQKGDFALTNSGTSAHDYSHLELVTGERAIGASGYSDGGKPGSGNSSHRRDTNEPWFKTLTGNMYNRQTGQNYPGAMWSRESEYDFYHPKNQVGPRKDAPFTTNSDSNDTKLPVNLNSGSVPIPPSSAIHANDNKPKGDPRAYDSTTKLMGQSTQSRMEDHSTKVANMFNNTHKVDAINNPATKSKDMKKSPLPAAPPDRRFINMYAGQLSDVQHG